MEPALIFLDITPRTHADQQKLQHALEVLRAEDSTLQVQPGARSDCVVIGTTSEACLERIVDRLTREFQVAAGVGRPTVAYLETLTLPAEGTAKYVRLTAGRAEYAHVCLRVQPGHPASGCTFVDATMGSSIPRRFITPVESGIRDAMSRGVLSGHPVVDVRVEVYDGSYHDVDSTDAAFVTAGSLAFLDAAKKPIRWFWSL